MHCSAMGKALLARMDERALETAFARPRDVRTMHTITSADALHAELEKVRAAGVAIDDEENELGVRCIGTVVLGAAGPGGRDQRVGPGLAHDPRAVRRDRARSHRRRGADRAPAGTTHFHEVTKR